MNDVLRRRPGLDNFVGVKDENWVGVSGCDGFSFFFIYLLEYHYILLAFFSALEHNSSSIYVCMYLFRKV